MGRRCSRYIERRQQFASEGSQVGKQETTMSKAFANPKIFAAVCLIFAGATIFNVSANASSDMKGMSLKAVPQVSAPVQEVGPTIPPNPWEDEMAPSGGGSSSRL